MNTASTEAISRLGTTWYRWPILAMCFVVLTMSFLIRVAWSSVAATVAVDLSFSPTIIGSFVTAFFSGYVLTNILSGFATDRLGPKLVICTALVPLAAFVALFGTIGAVWQGIAIQVGMGLFAGVNFAATTKLAASWFPQSERGLAFGVLTAATSTSVIIANTVFPGIIQRHSWQIVYYGLAAIVLVVAALAAIVIREGPLAPPHAVRSAQDETIPATARRLVSNRNYVLLGGAWFGGLWATWGVTFWSNTLLVQGHGLSNASAGAITALFATGGLVSKPIYGFLSDRLPIRRKTMLLPCFAGLVASLMAFGTAETETALRLIAPVLGVFAFAYTPITTAMLTEIIGARSVGAASGLMNAFIQASTIVAPLAVGFAFQASGSLAAAFAVLALGPAASIACVAMIREPKRARPSNAATSPAGGS